MEFFGPSTVAENIPLEKWRKITISWYFSIVLNSCNLIIDGDDEEEDDEDDDDGEDKNDDEEDEEEKDGNDGVSFGDNGNIDAEKNGNTDNGRGNGKPIVIYSLVISICICGRKWKPRVAMSILYTTSIADMGNEFGISICIIVI